MEVYPRYRISHFASRNQSASSTPKLTRVIAPGPQKFQLQDCLCGQKSLRPKSHVDKCK